MSDLASLLRRLSAVVAVAALAVAAMAGVAQASTSWGELGHFGGEEGPGPGQFELKEGTSAIGVDQENNSVFVVDLPDENGEYRIQKFEVSGGKYKVVASVGFTPADKEGPEDPDEVEGVAINSKTKRLYVLASEDRPEKKADPGDFAAAQLFAYSTEQSGEKLVPASGAVQTGSEAGVLAGAGILKPLGKPSEALIEPSGIAVDTHTGKVILLGEQEAKGASPLVTLEQLNETTGALESNKYVDETNFFGDEGYGAATSPAVSPEGNVYVTSEENQSELDEIPMNTAKTSFEKKPPTKFTALASQEELMKFPAEPPPEYGGSLSIGEEGTIYSTASIVEQLNGEITGSEYPGVIAMTSAGVEEGWVGGGSVATSGAGGACQIGIRAPSQLAAGSNHTVFVYDTGKYNTATKQYEPEVQEFGPGGGGCLTATATAPAASVNGQPVAENTEIPFTDEVTLASTITQANELSVEWNFGDGSTPVKQGPGEYQNPVVTHKFAKRGDLEVTETIKTDDLSTPEIVVHSKVDIETPEPTATTSAATSVTETSATLHGTVNPNGEAITECKFEYGLTETSEKSEPCSQSPASLGSGSSPIQVSLVVSGLVAHTGYHYKLVVKSAKAEGKGSSVSFTTTGEAGGGGGNGGGGGEVVQGGGAPPAGSGGNSGSGGVLNNITTNTPLASPVATLASSSSSVSASGAFTLKVSCPAGADSCSGTVTLKTLKAVVASVAHSAKSKAAILTLATASFSVTAGQVKTITLHLSAKARALLAHSHSVSARATIVAHGPTGLTHTTTVTVTLRPAKRHH
ncbi:MAG: PKD domain-containing protein [Solirubrobacteraceae bacterium]|jgi:hypothetical protein